MTLTRTVLRHAAGKLRLGALSGGESGSSLVELALIVSFVGIPLLLGTAEMGIIVYDSIEVSNAAHAAATYAAQSATYAANSSGIISAARAEAADFGASLSVTPTTYYVCASAVGGTQYTGANAQSNATAACTGGNNHAIPFVKVATSISVTSPFRCPGLTQTFSLTGSSVMEVEQ